jgi:hypothetical protein
MHATVISDQAECDRIWALADRVFAPYATYRREAAMGFFGRLSRQRHVERDPIAGQKAGILTQTDSSSVDLDGLTPEGDDIASVQCCPANRRAVYRGSVRGGEISDHPYTVAKCDRVSTVGELTPGLGATFATALSAPCEGLSLSHEHRHRHQSR